MNMGQKKNRKLIQPPSGLQGLLLGLLVLLTVLILFGIYSLVRLTARRISADYYFPYLKLARRTENWIADQSLLLQDKRSLARALQGLHQENAILSAERSIISDLKKENASLRTLMELPRKNGFRLVFAEVIQRDPMVWQEEFTIDKGERSGIRPGDLVVVQAYSDHGKTLLPAVIGRIRSVSGHGAQVSTVLSQDFRLAVSLPGMNASGILEGARHLSDLHAILKYVQMDRPPVSGQLVCTNSFSGNSPPGLPVGRIVSFGRTRKFHGNQLYLEADVQPFELPSEVRFVAVYARDGK